MKNLYKFILVISLFIGLSTAVWADEVELEGALIPVYIDAMHIQDQHEDKSLQYRFISKGKSYKVKFTQAPKDPKKIHRIKIKGDNRDGVINVASFKDVTPKTRLVNSTAAFAVGNKNVLVVPILGNYDSHFIYDAQVLSQLYFANSQPSLVSYYREVSKSRVSFSGQVVNPMKIPNVCTSSSRDLTGEALVDALIAINNSYNLSSYDMVSLVVPNSSSCLPTGVDGLGSYGQADLSSLGLPIIAFNIIKSNQVPQGNKNTFVSILAHEFGHNFGLKHANGNVCGESAFSSWSNCMTLAYGGAHSIMGSAPNLAPINAIHQENLGWLGSDSIHTVVGDTDQIFTISALESHSISPKAIRIKRSPTSSYVIEYHQPIGIATHESYPHEAAYEGFKVYIHDPYAISDSVLLRADMENRRSHMKYYLPETREYINPEEAANFAVEGDFAYSFHDTLNDIKVILEDRSGDEIRLRVLVGDENIKNAGNSDFEKSLYLKLWDSNSGGEISKFETQKDYRFAVASHLLSGDQFKRFVDRFELDIDDDGESDFFEDAGASASFRFENPGKNILRAKIYLTSGEIIEIEKKVEIVEPFKVELRYPKASISSELRLQANRPSKFRLNIEFSQDFMAGKQKLIMLSSTNSSVKTSKIKSTLKPKVSFMIALPAENMLPNYIDVDKNGYYSFFVYLKYKYVGSKYWQEKAVTFKVKANS